MGLTLCCVCGMREKAGGRKEMGVSTMADVIWEGWGTSVEFDVGEEVERGVAEV